jgi:hypothetical protein
MRRPASTKLWIVKDGRSLLPWTAARVRRESIGRFIENMPEEWRDWRKHRRSGFSCVLVTCIELENRRTPPRRRDGRTQLTLPMSQEAS